MRLLHTEPLSRVVERLRRESQHAYNVSHAHVTLVKSAGEPVTTHSLSGELYASKSGWLLLDVPNAIVRGAFDALNEPGAELPPQLNGKLNAHISVMRPEEIARIGGINKITERGHHFHYTLGPIQAVKPDGWDEMSKVWFIQVRSKELQDLRKSYGLSPKPNDGKSDFQITIAVRRKKVLQNNDVAKAAATKDAGLIWPLLTVGGIVTDIAGLKALSGHGKNEGNEEEDPAEKVMEDETALHEVQSLPVTVPPLRRRRKIVPPPVLTPVLKEGADYAMRRMQQTTEEAEEPDAEASAKPDGQDKAAMQELRADGPKDDFECSPAALEAIYAHYGRKSDSNGHSGTNQSVINEQGKSAAVPIRAFQPQSYGKNVKFRSISHMNGHEELSGIHSDSWGSPVKTLKTFGQKKVAAANEVVRTYSGNDDYKPKKQKRRNTLIDKLKTMVLPASAAGAAGLALHSPTNTLIPVQTTRFPNDPKPHLIRGPIYPGAPASVFDDTGGGYMLVGPHVLRFGGYSYHFPRMHAYVNDPNSLRQALQKQQRPGVPLQLLDVEGHGSPVGQWIGDSEYIGDQIGPLTYKHIAETLRNTPHTNDATIIGGGCNSGLCKPRYSWWQRVADESGWNAMGGRGYGSGYPEAKKVIPDVSGYMPYTETEYWNPTVASRWTLHQPHKPQQVIQTEDRDGWSKNTWGMLPSGRLPEFLYNIGKPSALAGAIAAPLFSDRKTARRTAILASALATPMALSEIAARYGQTRANIESDLAPNKFNEYLRNQGKALPYVALAALPLLSYGGARLLGRWKHQKDTDKRKSLAHTIGALGGGSAGMLAGSLLGPLGAAGGGILGALLGERAGKQKYEKKHLTLRTGKH